MLPLADQARAVESQIEFLLLELWGQVLFHAWRESLGSPLAQPCQ